MSSSGRRLEWSARSWWCALATLVVIALGRVEGLPIWSFWLVAGVGVFAARPRVRTGWPWYAVAVALVVSTGGDFTGRRSQPISEGIDRFCGDMLAMAERVTSDQELRRLFSVSGEALEPDLPFRILRDELGDVSGRTLYLADDFGELVAWAGEQRSYPAGVRPLGQRQWGLVWFTQRVVLWVREPVLIDGRIVGAVTVADSADRVSGQAWGMTARSGEQILLFPTGTERGLPAEPRPGFAFRVETGEVNERSSSPLLILGLVVLAVVSAVARPRWAWLPALAAGVVWSLIAQDFFSLGTAMVVIVGSAALSRAAVDIGGWAGKTIVSTGLLALCVPTFTASNHALASWLPDRLLTPGWPVVWLLASAILASGWPTIGGGSDRSLARRIVIAAGLAAVGLLLEVAHVPVALLRAERTQPVSVPESLPDEARSMLDDGSAALFLDDSAHLLAKSWNLNDWQVPTSVVVLDDEGAIVSIWGDLTPAGDSVALLESYAVPNQEGIVAELWGAIKPWASLPDWRPDLALRMNWQSPIWFAVLSRSGSVAATRHPQIKGMDAGRAGTLFHRGKGWTWMRMGNARLPARVWRDDEWLVAAIARQAEISVWAVQAAIACLWALCGLVISSPPVWRVGQLGTFGGRLRLLIAGGVVVPLMTLTLFLQMQISRDSVRREQSLAHDAVGRAQSTIEHLQAGFNVDDELAGWLARQIGAETAFFSGASLNGISRPDSVVGSVFPELPLAEAYPLFVLGRDDVVLGRQLGRLVAAKTVEIGGQRVLLQVFPEVGLRAIDAPQPVDWLLTGAALAALIALSLTSRIENRLSSSLLELVALARRLQRGEPLAVVRSPVESDLAEVVSAVRLMSEEVQRREEGLKHQQELLRITLGTLESAVLVRDADGAMIFANPSAEQLLVDADNRVAEIWDEMAGRTARQKGPVVETVQPFPGIETTWRVAVADVPLPDQSRGLVVVVDDITQVVRLDRLKQLNQTARIVAHEVKNPLTPIRLWVQELEEAQRRKDPGLEDLLREACDEISTQVQRLEATASSFTNLAALERWEPSSVDLVELVNDTLDGLNVLERRGVHVNKDVTDEGVCVVVGDRAWLRRALDNVVKNSIDAIGDGRGEIWIRVVEEADRAVLEVEDSAGGVVEAQLEDLFRPQFSTTSSGSGLGLALVSHVVARCHGAVNARNGEDGLVVRMVLPLASDRMTP